MNIADQLEVFWVGDTLRSCLPENGEIVKQLVQQGGSSCKC
jgi:hypothetical protein